MNIFVEPVNSLIKNNFWDYFSILEHSDMTFLEFQGTVRDHEWGIAKHTLSQSYSEARKKERKKEGEVHDYKEWTF